MLHDTCNIACSSYKMPIAFKQLYLFKNGYLSTRTILGRRQSACVILSSTIISRSPACGVSLLLSQCSSGATVHWVGDTSLLSSIYYNHHPVLIKVADARCIRAYAVGTAQIPFIDKKGRTLFNTIHNDTCMPT